MISVLKSLTSLFDVCQYAVSLIPSSSLSGQYLGKVIRKPGVLSFDSGRSLRSFKPQPIYKMSHPGCTPFLSLFSLKPCLDQPGKPALLSQNKKHLWVIDLVNPFLICVWHHQSISASKPNFARGLSCFFSLKVLSCKVK